MNTIGSHNSRTDKITGIGAAVLIIRAAFNASGFGHATEKMSDLIVLLFLKKSFAYFSHPYIALFGFFG